MEYKANHGQIAIEVILIVFALVLILVNFSTGSSNYLKLHKSVNQDELRTLSL